VVAGLDVEVAVGWEGDGRVVDVEGGVGGLEGDVQRADW